MSAADTALANLSLRFATSDLRTLKEMLAQWRGGEVPPPYLLEHAEALATRTINELGTLAVLITTPDQRTQEANYAPTV